MTPFTGLRRLRLLFAASRIDDRDLAELVLRLADGEDTRPEIHDRLNVLGRFELADRLRRIVGENP